MLSQAVGLCMAFIAALMTSAPASADDSQITESLIVVNKLGDTLSIIDPTTGEERHRVPVGEGPHEVAVSPDGRIAVVTNYGRTEPGRSLSVIDVVKGRAKRTIDLEKYHRPHGVAFMADGKRVVVTAEQDQSLLIVDVIDGAVIAAIGTDQRISHMVALSPDERIAYVPNIGSGSVSIIDLVENRLIKNLPTGYGAEGVAVHPKRQEVWISNRSADNVSIVCTESMEVTATLASPRFPIRAAISPDGRYALVVNARSSSVSVFDTEQRSRKKVIEVEAESKPDEGRMFARTFGDSSIPVGVVFNPQGTRAYVALTRSDVVAVIDTATWKVIEHFETDREPDGLAWSRAATQGDKPN